MVILQSSGLQGQRRGTLGISIWKGQEQRFGHAFLLLRFDSTTHLMQNSFRQGPWHLTGFTHGCRHIAHYSSSAAQAGFSYYFIQIYISFQDLSISSKQLKKAYTKIHQLNLGHINQLQIIHPCLFQYIFYYKQQRFVNNLYMKDQSKLVFFIKKIGKQACDAQEKEKKISKIGIQKTYKHLKEQNLQDNSYSDSHLSKNDQVYPKEDLKPHQNQLYRPLEPIAQASQSERGSNDIVQKRIKFTIKKCVSIQSIDQPEKIGLKNKLYKIPIGTNKLRQKCDKKLISLIKIPHLNDQNGSTISQNFDTYEQFNHFIAKLSDQTQQSNNQTQNMAIVTNNNRKCSIIPALRPAISKQKSQSYQEPNSSTSRFQQYMLARHTRKKMEKSLIVKSKKQQLATHIISRYKMTHRCNRQQSRLKTLENESESFVAEGNDEHRSLETNNGILKVSGMHKKKQEFSSNLSNRTKTQRSNTFFSNSHSQEGVYQQKLRSYREFLFTVNLAHRVFDPLIIFDGLVVKSEKITIFRPTYYIGNGNNSMLLRSLMKRRTWWEEVHQSENANFIWTQLKDKSILQSQQSLGMRKFDKKNSKYITNYSKAQILEAESQSIQSPEKMNHNIQSNKKSPILVSSSIINPKGLIFRAPFAVNSTQKILTQSDSKMYRKTRQKSLKDDNFEQRLRQFPKDYFNLKQQMKTIKVHNHFQFNHYVGNKKSLFYHLQLYYRLVDKHIEDAIPITFHIKAGENGLQFRNFLQEYQRIRIQSKDLQNIWILKPGQNSNRGCGISLFKQLIQLNRMLRKGQKHKNGELKTFIIQKYIEKPLLYWGRKFDIRHYLIISGIHGRIRAYWHGQGYIRTSSYMFNLGELSDTLIHLTNDAIQKQSEDYGCHEQGNKISYNQLQKYFNKEMPEINFDMEYIFGRMRDLARDVVLSTYYSLDPNNRLHNFQVFGLDFMIDEKMSVFLIQANTNPCLQLSSNLLSRIIPTMLDQTLRVTLDPLFPPSVHYTNNTKHLIPDCSFDKLQMELIFDSGRDGQDLCKLYEAHQKQYKEIVAILQGTEKEMEDVYENEGAQIDDETLIV